MWKEQRFEAITKQSLEGFDGADASLWSRYEMTRSDILANVLPYIATKEPGLSDHGVDHVANVLRNVGQVLGIDGSGVIYREAPVGKMPAVERLLLLLGCLLHDIGNIRGRSKHNLMTSTVWRDSGNQSFQQWNPADRKTILSLCQAHTGVAPDGSRDTLKPLATGNHYFLGQNVPLAKLAATLRFADELAEGVQRTSRFLLFQQEYGASNIDYHRYANAVEVIIDRANGRVALTYTIELTDPGMADGDGSLENLRRLLAIVFKRVIKLELERSYARHYAPDMLAFTETSIVIDITRNHERVCELPALVLNDFNMRNENVTQISMLENAYNVEKIIATIGSDIEGGRNA